MKTSVVVLAVLSLAILVSVSDRSVVQARDAWPGPDVVAATNGLSPGEAVITWDTVEAAAYYRIGWVARADREVGADGDARWREGFVFADVANRGQASHLITGLTPGVEYDFVVASHDGRWSRLPGTGGLASLRLGEDPSYFRLFDSAEAEVALEPVEGTRYRRIGWIAKEAYRNAVDGDGDWRRSVQFMDLANRGQTSQVITGLKLGAEYYVAVASHDDPGGVAGWLDAAEWELVTARSAWQSVSFQNSEACAAHDMVPLPTGFEEGIARYLCQDDAGENYWIFVPTAYTDPDAVVKQLHGRAFDELGEVDNRVEAYKSLIVEVASQKALGERAHLSIFFDFNEGNRGPITAADDIIGDVIDAYGLGYQEGSQQYRDLENHLRYLLEHSDIYDDQPFGSIEFDAAILAAVSRTIFIDQTREHVRLLEQLPLDSAWPKAIEEAKEVLNRKSSGDDLTEWGEFLEKYHDDIVLGLHVVAKVGAHVAAHAIGTALGIAASPVAVALSVVVIVGFEVYERIHETNEFWDDLTLATVAAQAYWHTHRNRRDDGALTSAVRGALLGYTEFSFYQHLYLAADNPLAGASPIGIGNLGETNPSEFVQTLLERRDLVLDRLIDSAWEPTRDFKPLYDATGLPYLPGLNEPTGMWSDGDTMWVSQKAGTTLRAFDMETKLWVEELDFDTARPYEGISFTDIWSDEETLWIAARLLLDRESTRGGLYAYDVTSQQDDATQSLYTLAGRNHLPWGVWSNGTTIWVSNAVVSKIYAYDLATRQRDRAKDFDGLRLAGNDSPHGIWSDEKTMWVADREDDKVYAYDLATARRDPAREFNLVNVPGVVTNTEPGGIWSDGTSMWVIDGAERKIFAYALPGAPAAVEAFPFGRDPAGDLGRLNATENHHAEGIWSDGTTMWVVDHDADRIYAYRLSDGARVEELGFDLYNRLLFEGNHHARGIWSDGTTMWVADHDDDRVYAYRLSDGARVEELEFGDEVLKAAGNEYATGIWFDATAMTMWVADPDDNLIYGYDQETRTLVRTIDTLQAAGNHDAEGIWSDGTTMWVADHDDDRIYAYRLSDGARVEDLEFDTPSAAGNHDMRGIWSDGTTMWVADQDKRWVYAYHMPPLAEILPLGNPTNLTAAPGSQAGEVVLRWTAAANAEFYEVYIWKEGDAEGHPWQGSLGGDADQLIVTNLEPGQTYRFWVRAGQVVPGGDPTLSEWSNVAEAVIGGPATGPTDVQPSAVSSGWHHTCGLRFDGSVVCWGSGEYGQTTPPPAEAFITISSGLHHTCGLRSDGSAACWGNNQRGQSTPPSGATFDAISSGGWHTCGLRSNGSVACWGDDEYGQSTPPSGATFDAISSGGRHTCGLRSNGSVACWGDDEYGQSTPPSGATFDAISSGWLHTCGLRSGGLVDCWGWNNVRQAAPPPEETFATVSSGSWHTCGLRSNGSVACWGDNRHEQITAPVGESFIAIDAGDRHTCGLRLDGSVFCWGWNQYGQTTPPAGEVFAVGEVSVFLSLPLGNPTNLAAAPGSQTGEVVLRWMAAANATVQWVYLVKPDGTDGRYWPHAQAGDAATLTVTGLDAGETYYFLVIAGQEQADGNTLWSQWSNWGQADATGVAPLATGEATFTAISSGASHTCGLRSDGSVACWGSNDDDQATPPAGETFTAVSSGGAHTCGLRSDGSVVCWGGNEHGQATPPAGETFTTISNGGSHTCGLRANGTPVCWGKNIDRTGRVVGQSTPPSGETFAAINGGGDHTCALRTNGTVRCWGSNLFGESAPPNGTVLASLSDHSYYHTCGLDAQGTAICWGISFFGVTRPPTGETFSAVGSGDRHTCGLRADGSAICWGSASDGSGRFQGKLIPPEGETFTTISVGWNHTCGITTAGAVACWGDDSHGQSTPPAELSSNTLGKYDTDGDRLIEISSLEQLDAIRYDLDGDGIPSDAAYGGAFPISAGEVVCDDCNGYELIRSLDFRDPGSYLSGSVNEAWITGSGWQPIAGGIHSWPDNFDTTISRYTFTATLAGNGHIVSNLYANRSSYRGVALFRHTGRSSVIRDIGLTDVNLTGGNDVGALAGYGFGKIITSYAGGAISGRLSVGGLIGTNEGGITASYSRVDVQGIGHVGGLVGWNAGSIDASYAVGKVAGVWHNTGGLSGVDSGNVTAGYWDRQTSGQATSAGGEGRTTVELQAPTGYTGIYGNWNVDVDGDTVPDDPWDFGNSRQYPVLKYGDFSVAGQRIIVAGDVAQSGTLGNPRNLTATPGSQSGEVVLRWTPAANAQFYEVYLLKVGDAEGDYWQGSLGGDADQLIVTNLEPGQTYRFWVRAGQVVPNGDPTLSEWSNLAEAVVSGSAATAPDLEVYSPRVYDKVYEPGERFDMSFSIRNQGGAASTGTASVKYYRSSDANINSSDTEIEIQTGLTGVGPIAASGQSSVTIRLTAHTSGVYYYGACVGTVPGETDTTNNCAAIFRVTLAVPDLGGAVAVGERQPRGGRRPVHVQRHRVQSG